MVVFSCGAGEDWAGGAAQPWRCLWRGFSQITMTRPWRRITLHLSQIFLTLGLTFMRTWRPSCFSFGWVGNPAKPGVPAYLYR